LKVCFGDRWFSPGLQFVFCLEIKAVQAILVTGFIFNLPPLRRPLPDLQRRVRPLSPFHNTGTRIYGAWQTLTVIHRDEDDSEHIIHIGTDFSPRRRRTGRGHVRYGFGRGGLYGHAGTNGGGSDYPKGGQG